MKQTAVQWLEEQLQNCMKNYYPINGLVEQAKEMEKQQIIDAYYGYELYLDREFRFQQGGQAKILTFDQWYETYGSKGSDDNKINLVEIPQEQLEKERNPNYKYFDTSSQTAVEWLIEQMFKQGYFDGNKPLSITNLDHLQHQAKEMEYNQRGYTKEDVLKAGEIGEINHHDYKHIVKLLDEAREINETYGSKGSDETKTK